MSGSVVEAAAEKARLGDVVGATRLLSDALASGDPAAAEGRAAILQALVEHLVAASRHREAFERAQDLRAYLGIASASPIWLHSL